MTTEGLKLGLVHANCQLNHSVISGLAFHCASDRKVSQGLDNEIRPPCCRFFIMALFVLICRA